MNCYFERYIDMTIISVWVAGGQLCSFRVTGQDSLDTKRFSSTRLKYVTHLLSTIVKESSVGIHISLVPLSIGYARVVQTRGEAAVFLNIADLHHSLTIARRIFTIACLGGN